jgi:hypothetical protein
MAKNLREVLLKTARDDFPNFYTQATAREAKLMDILVLLTALTLRLKATALESAAATAKIEDTSAAVERTFLELRGELRASSTFAGLPALEKGSIERVIFGRVP